MSGRVVTDDVLAKHDKQLQRCKARAEEEMAAVRKAAANAEEAAERARQMRNEIQEMIRTKEQEFRKQCSVM
ncbi:hypothetical protein BESB_000160 [Besnoitia besnoiti]|uniref:Uncharacterized protein n=1 Tax=Besnoitia besnoiti TaxID=94643 RepID=A0A2A9MKD9_BESBE|nr:hypothetical protein BESB_000160 [Besnoitia besnoiti]PFH37674.1 hypothetical protein BESB_000160 [Besnoitia besnoiti]